MQRNAEFFSYTLLKGNGKKPKDEAVLRGHCSESAGA